MILQDFQTIILEIISPGLQHRLFLIKSLFLIISFGLGGFIFYILRKTDWLKYQFGQDLIEFRSFKASESLEFIKKWETAKKRLKKAWEPELKLAIIESDQLLDDSLKKMGYEGESLGERLDQLSIDILPNLQEVWEAHRTRNNIVHDPDYRLTFNKAHQVMDAFGQAFRYLEIL